MPTPRTPVVFIRGLWIHATAWADWLQLFRDAGYEPLAPNWPGDAPTPELTRADPEAVAGLGIADLTAHFAGVIAELPAPPVLVGHSLGGLIAQILHGRGLARAAVAIDPGQFKGVRPLPLAQLRAAFPVLRNPANARRAVSLTGAQFRYSFGNALSEQESQELHDRWTIPSPGRPVFEAAVANFRRHSPTVVDTANARRGPLLLVSGGKDHIVPDVVTHASAKQYRKSPAVTDLRVFPDRGHSLVLDHGRVEVAESVLEWLARHHLLTPEP